MDFSQIEIRFASHPHDGDHPIQEACHDGVRLHPRLFLGISSQGHWHRGSLFVNFSLDDGVTKCSFAEWLARYGPVLDHEITSNGQRVEGESFDHISYSGLGLKVFLSTHGRAHFASLRKNIGPPLPVKNPPRCGSHLCRVWDVDSLVIEEARRGCRVAVNPKL